MSDINVNNDYTKMNNLSPFKLCVIQNFPFIEADFDAVTNYQLLCKVVEYLNNVIDNNNKQNTNITQLEQNFITLYNYIKDFFDNLDLQEEINTKLDSMVADGSFADIVKPIVSEFFGNRYRDFENKKIAVYGDSWVDSTLPYHAWCDTYLKELTKADIHSKGIAGSTFAGINKLFDNYFADIYIIFGGINDSEQNRPTLETRDNLNNLIGKIYSVNREALIYVCTVPVQIECDVVSSTGAVRYYPMEVYRQTVWNTVNTRGVRCISGLHVGNLNLTSDKLHPADDYSYLQVAKWVADGLLRGGDTRDYIQKSRDIPSEGTLYINNGNVRYVLNRSLTYNNGKCIFPTWYKDDVTSAIQTAINCLTPGGLKPCFSQLTNNGIEIDSTDTTLNGEVPLQYGLVYVNFIPSGMQSF